MSRLRVDLGALAALVEELARFEAHLVRLRERADADGRRLDTSWVGAAAAAEATVQAGWAAGAADVHSALREMRALLATAQQNYDTAVAANRRMWAR